jgi:hypothetical protein
MLKGSRLLCDHRGDERLQSSERGQSFKRPLLGNQEKGEVLSCFNPLNEVSLLKDGLFGNLKYHPSFCFNPLNEVSLLKEHLHFTIDSLGRQGAFLHTPATPAKIKCCYVN